MKYFIVTVIVIFLMLIGAIVLVSRRGSNGPEGTEAKVTLTDYVTSSSEVVYTTDGRINGEEQHRSIRISVSQERRKFEVIQGYDGMVISQQIFSNDRAAYDVFINALHKVNFIRERENAPQGDEKGVCPSGLRYIYELKNNGEEIRRLWNSSCGENSGTFGGNSSVVRQLFRQQIPEYNKLSGSVNLYQ